ncbi:MAG TPA: hypothetical protein VGV14_04105 [Rhodanobacter sp.]|nr:hypothetical protein [Rhodanobacter sp.]
MAFISMSSNLATGVTMPGMSIYLRVPANQATTLVSANADGARANAPSVDPTFASRGRYVVFSSNATNLTSERTFGKKQIFRKDLVSKQVVLVSVDADGEAAAGDNAYASVSADGNIIAFTSYAALAPGCTATHVNIYVRDVARSKTTCLSVGSNGEEANDGSFQPSISADGSKVAFRSSANNLVSGDTNRVDDVFVRDMTTNTTTLVSVGVDGESANAESTEPSISGDGTRVAFTSNASNLVAGSNHHVEEIFVRDLAKGKTILASSRDGKTFADGTSVQPRLSLDGNTVVFMSAATNLTPQPTNGHRNIYALDLAKKQLRRISVATHGADLNGDCFQPAVSADGSIVAFRSNASNLVESDTNLTDDVFVQVALP